MATGSILGNALSALYVNQEALRITSNNIANVNTENYSRKVADREARIIDGQSVGVEISQVRRVVDSFLVRESLLVNSTYSKFAAEAKYHTQMQSTFGSPDQHFSISSRLDAAFKALGDLSIDVSSAVRRSDALSDLQQLNDTFDYLSTQVQMMRGDIDKTINSNVTTLNRLFERVHELNEKIEREMIIGGDVTALQDQRDGSIKEIAELVDVRVSPQPSGAVRVMTTDGFVLVGTMRTELSYAVNNDFTAGTTPTSIQATTVNPITGETIPPVINFDPHVTNGEIRGLLTMRDETLPALAEELGTLAGAVMDQLNAIHNDNVAYPAANSLTGRNTGLIATDSLNFTGRSSIAVVANDGLLVSRVDLDFDAGTLTVDGGAPVAFGSTIGSLTTAINTALGGNGSASFVNGALTIQATNPANGVGFAQDPTVPSDRAGRGFAHFFGMNDLITGYRPSHYDVGISGTDLHGFTAGEIISFKVRNLEGKESQEFTYTITGGGTINDILNDLNNPTTGFGAYMTFAIGTNGGITATPTPSYKDYDLFVTDDLTQRGTTGTSFTDLFGIGDFHTMEMAKEMTIASHVNADHSLLSLAKLDLTGATAGSSVLTQSDNQGALNLHGLATTNVSIASAGFLGAATATLSEYSAIILGDTGSRAAQVDALMLDSAALQEEVNLRKDSIQGVNMDEELANMMVYQQSYNAAARLVTAARELYDTLLAAV